MRASVGRTHVSERPSKRVGMTASSVDHHDETEALLADGSSVHLRPLTPNDRERLLRFFEGLSVETRRNRFFSPIPTLEGPLLERLLAVDNIDVSAIVAERQGEIVGVGRAHRIDAHSAEVAFTVSDRLQGHGIGTVLLEALAHHVKAVGTSGIDRFVAITRADNSAMIRVFRDVGYPVSVRHNPSDPSEVRVDLTLDPAADTYLRAHRIREHTASARSLRPLLHPRSIAVIGAGRRLTSPGRRIVDQLVAHGFTGSIVAVNPLATDGISDLHTVASVEDIGAPIDLAIIAVPAAAVVGVAEQCGRAGVGGLLVVSSGFSEIGEIGRERQAELLRVVRSFGMRLIGPNCLGVVTTDETIRMHAIFTDLTISPGRIALMSQSGAVAMAIASLAANRGIGLSSLVSVGNKADVSGNDLLEYWDEDPNTRVIALYLESFGNPRTFARRARDISRRKPIVAIKAARSAAGSRAAASHTGALMSEDSTVDALFEQAGVLRVDDPNELLSLASALDCLPLPTGRRVAVIGNAGGLAILTVDALVAEHMTAAELHPATHLNLQQFAPSNASLNNPIDLTADASIDQLCEAVRVVSNDTGIDAIVVVYVSVKEETVKSLTCALGTLVTTSEKPIVTLLATTINAPQQSEPRLNLSLVDSPRQAALTLSRMAARYEWLHRDDKAELPISADDISRIRSIISNDAAERPESSHLTTTTAAEILDIAGIATAAPVFAPTAADAAEIGASLGFPVCLKAANPDLAHRSDLNAVWIGLRDEFNVECAFHAMEQHLGPALGGVIVQPQADEGVEMIVGIVNDRAFGPLVMVGAGGREAELWRDTRVHLAPVNRKAALAMVSSLRSAPLLTGFRGSKPADVDALVDAVVRIAQLAAEIPEIAVLDANPIIVHPKGATAVDVKITRA